LYRFLMLRIHDQDCEIHPKHSFLFDWCSWAIIRKISGGSRSDAGTKTRMALASLFETWLARGLNALQECLRALSAPAPTAA
jgi:hypothetical protein